MVQSRAKQKPQRHAILGNSGSEFWGRFGRFSLGLSLVTALGLPFSMVASAAQKQNANLTPGSVIATALKDGAAGPVLVVVPSGVFMMGSEADEPGRDVNESPRRRVAITDPFAMGRTEVTVGEFRNFVARSGYITEAEKGAGSYARHLETGEWRYIPGLNWRHDPFGALAQDANPVVHVSWNDAQAYVKWLAQETGQAFRLPTEAELEYSNRAGTTTRFWWGDDSPKSLTENIRGEGDIAKLPAALQVPHADDVAVAFKDGYTEPHFSGYQDGFGGVSPVGRLKPNPFGLYDTSGNVWEWAQDCWHENYVGAPADGRAWTDDQQGNCANRVMRGGSYYCYPRHVRAANRWAGKADFRNMYVGFRVARDL